MINKDKLIIIITIIILILCIISLPIILKQDNVRPHKTYKRCFNGSIEEFNRSDLMVCGVPNPMNMPYPTQINIDFIENDK